MRSSVKKLTALSRARKRAIIVAFDVTAMTLALWLAFCIRYGEFYTPVNRWVVPLAAVAILFGIVGLALLGIYKVVIRYIDVHAALKVAVGAGAVAAIWFILAYVSRVNNVPRSVGFIYFGIVFLFMFFGRLAAARLLNGDHDGSLHVRGPQDGSVKKMTGVAIFGATSAGSSLAEALRRHPKYRLRCFVDDNPALVGRAMVGAPIRSSEQLRDEIESGAVEQVFLAIQSATRNDRMAALASLSGLGVPVMTIPS